MAGIQVEIKQETDDWNTLVLPEGTDIEEGQKIYRAPRIVLIEGKEVEMAEPVWGGTYNLENGSTIEVLDGVIIEVTESIKVLAKKRKDKYKKKILN